MAFRDRFARVVPTTTRVFFIVMPQRQTTQKKQPADFSAGWRGFLTVAGPQTVMISSAFWVTEVSIFFSCSFRTSWISSLRVLISSSG